MPFTATDKLEAVNRELGFRRRVYPRFIEEGKMSKGHADRQIAIFEEIAADYGKLAEGERLL